MVLPARYSREAPRTNDNNRPNAKDGALFRKKRTREFWGAGCQGSLNTLSFFVG